MGEIVKIYADKSVAVRSWDALYRDSESRIYYLSTLADQRYNTHILLGFTLPPQYYYSSVVSASIFVAKDYGSESATIKVYCPSESIDFNTVSYSTLGKFSPWGNSTLAPSIFFRYVGDAYYGTGKGYNISYARQAIYRGIVLPTQYSDSIPIYSANSEYIPYLEIEFGTGKCAVAPQTTEPSAGAHKSYKFNITFSATLGYNSDAVSVYLPIPTSVKFRWRAKDSDTYTEIDLAKKTTCTIPANTFPKGDIEYKFVITDSGGSTSESAWVEISTEDSLSTANPLSPIATLVDSTSPVAFSWQHLNTSNAPQSQAELQISDNGSTWETLIVSSGAATETTVPSGAITSGTHYWRVRTYNQDDIAGAWSDSAQFEAVGSPPAPIVTALDTSPRPAVVWQTPEQEAWRIVFNGETTTRYGNSKEWESPSYVEDGKYTLSIQTQNQYGIWGAITENIFYVVNTPGPAVTLSVLTGGASAVLTWNEGNYDFFLVYRDGTAIAKVTAPSYIDFFSCGTCEYQVRGCYSVNNNYGLSNKVAAEIYPPSPVIIDAETHSLLYLDLSEQQHRTYSHARARQIASYHVVGRALPTVDVTEFSDESLSLSCAVWAEDKDTKQQLEALIGRTVCLKTDTGERAVGVLAAVSKTVQMFYTTYQLSVTNTDFEEEVVL